MKLGIGELFIFDGVVFEVVCTTDVGVGGMVYDKNKECKYNPETVYLVNKKKAVPYSTHEFEIGDIVKSNLRSNGDSFVGIIVGYEAEDDIFVCKSVKLDNYKDKRVRYAYKRYELEPVEVATKYNKVEVL